MIKDLDRFIRAMLAIADEAEKDPEKVTGAPWLAPVRRMDEVRAARKPILRWKPPSNEEQA